MGVYQELLCLGLLVNTLEVTQNAGGASQSLQITDTAFSC